MWLYTKRHGENKGYSNGRNGYTSSPRKWWQPCQLAIFFPKSVLGTFDLEGIPVAWENDPTIRERIRENKNLCLVLDHDKGSSGNGYVDATCDNLKLNASVLKPVLMIMKDHQLQLLSIEKLITAVNTFFQLTKLSRTPEQAYQEAWAIRRMIGRVKKFLYRTLPPQELFVLHAK